VTIQVSLSLWHYRHLDSFTTGKFHLQRPPSELVTSTPKSSLAKRIAVIFATQTVFIGISLLGLNWYHGKYDLTLNVSHVPWWHLFLCFGVANIGAQVVLSKTGFGHIL